jgi:hypothetical protein
MRGKALPFRQFINKTIEAPPQIRGVASNNSEESFIGKAKPFRTSGGKAAFGLNSERYSAR